MRQRPPLPPDERAEAPDRPPEGPAGLRPMPPHDGPFAPPGQAPAGAFAPTDPALPPAPATEELATVEELAERFGLHERDERGRDRNRFLRNVMWNLEGYAQGQLVTPKAFSDALHRARNLPLNGSPDPGRKNPRRRAR